jgi:hypothetical protein
MQGLESMVKSRGGIEKLRGVFQRVVAWYVSQRTLLYKRLMIGLGLTSATLMSGTVNPVFLASIYTLV